MNRVLYKESRNKALRIEVFDDRTIVTCIGIIGLMDFRRVQNLTGQDSHCGTSDYTLHVMECPNLLQLNQLIHYPKTLIIEKCKGLAKICIKSHKIHIVDCPNLKKVGIYCNTMTYMNLKNCPQLETITNFPESLDFIKIETCNLTKTSFNFTNCHLLTKLDLKDIPVFTLATLKLPELPQKLGTVRVITVRQQPFDISAFYNCNNLKVCDLNSVRYSQEDLKDIAERNISDSCVAAQFIKDKHANDDASNLTQNIAALPENTANGAIPSTPTNTNSQSNNLH